MVTDPISNLIVAIKNGSDARKIKISIPYSVLKESIVVSLVKAGFVKSYEKNGKGVTKTLNIELAYTGVGGGAAVNGVSRVSKPSRRMYHGVADIRPFKNGYGRIVYSTPKGVLLDEEAKKLKVGGEVLFKIW